MAEVGHENHHLCAGPWYCAKAEVIQDFKRGAAVGKNNDPYG